MAFTLIAHGGELLGTNGGTTVGAGVLNTTGCDFIVVVEHFFGTTSGTLSDSRGLSGWTALTKQDSNPTECGCVIWYNKNANGGTGHSFTITGSSSFSAVEIAAFSGSDLTAPFDVEVGVSVITSTTTPIPQITPSVANELIIWGCTLIQSTATCTIDVGTELDETASTAVYCGASAYEIQTTATARTATWTHTSYKSSGVAATFKSAAGGGGNLSAFIGEPITGSSALL
jgi:hypothetical protein